MIDRPPAEAVLERIEAEELAELAGRTASVREPRFIFATSRAPRGADGELCRSHLQWCVESREHVEAVLERSCPARRARPRSRSTPHIDTWMSRDDFLIFRDPSKEVYHRDWREGDLLQGTQSGTTRAR